MFQGLCKGKKQCKPALQLSRGGGMREDIDLLPDLAATSVSSSQSRVQRQDRNMHHGPAGGCRCGPAAGLLPSFDLSWYLLLVMVHIEFPSWSCSEERLQAADTPHENPCLEHLDLECLYLPPHGCRQQEPLHCSSFVISVPDPYTNGIYYVMYIIIDFTTAVLPVSTDDPRGHRVCRLQCQSRRGHLG